MPASQEMRTVVSGIEITWRSKPARLDAAHLVVVFSGFGAQSEFTYDFIGALDHCPADVIWIKDSFHGRASYYSSGSNPDYVADAVNDFIEEKLNTLGLSKQMCTLLGASKGGSAALMYGLRYDYKNIIASVPQLRPGLYIQQYWPEIYKHILGPEESNDIEEFDLRIISCASKCAADKNIYLLTSEIDTQYLDQIHPYLDVFSRFENFNLVYVESQLVNAHNQITSYATPLILGLLNSLSMGFAPEGISGRTSAKHLSPPTKKSGAPIVDLRAARFEADRFILEGVGALRGFSCKEWRDIDYKLILRAGVTQFTIPLAKDHRAALTRELFDGSLVFYDKAWFCTPKHKGIDISHVPSGTYQMFIEIRCAGVFEEAAIKSANKIHFKIRSVRGYELNSDSASSSITIFD
ncbi:MAG: hypothetical protein MUF74_06410 [Cypionkella sp.]|nr:hypothetical protein [Cypionkella sp.]